MPELSLQQAEELVQSNSIENLSAKSEYLNRFSVSPVLYIETAYDPQINEWIVRNLDKIKSFYNHRHQRFVYLPLLLKDGGNIFEYACPGMKLNQPVVVENITSTITTKLLAELDVSPEIQGPMLLTFSNNNSTDKPGWVITSIRGSISVEQFFLTHSRIYNFSYEARCKCSMVLPSFPNNPEMLFDDEINKIVSEIDERICLLKKLGLYHLLVDTIAPMLTPKLSSLCITEDYRIFLPDYNNMEISMNPLSKAVYFLFLRHPEGIYIKKMSMYKDELTQIYRLISNRESLENMNESINKLVDPKNNSFCEKCSRIKRSFIEHFSDELAQHYYVVGGLYQPKQILLPCDMVSLPDALKNIKMICSGGLYGDECSGDAQNYEIPIG